MGNDENDRIFSSLRISKIQAYERLLETVLGGACDACQKRSEVLEYCRQEGLEESDVWIRLVTYAYHGCAWLMGDKGWFAIFDQKRRKLRRRIADLIWDLPEAAVQDLSALVEFRKCFLDRIEYVSDLLVYFFVERKKGLWMYVQDSHVFTEYFNNKLFREFEAINDMVATSASIEELRAGYNNWLFDQALDVDVPL